MIIFLNRDELTTKEICKKLGHPLLIADTEDILRRYKEKYSKTLTREQKTYADFSRSVYPAAAFFIAAHKNKVKITQTAIASNLDLQKPELQKVISSIQITLDPPEKKVEQKPIIISSNLKRKLDNNDNNGDNDDIHNDNINTHNDNEDKKSLIITTTNSNNSNNNNLDDDNYVAFRKIAEDLGLQCDDSNKKESKTKTTPSQPPLKKPKKYIQTTLNF